MMGLVAETASTATRIEWRNLPESWQAFVAFGAVLALAAYVIWSYRREADTLGPGVRALLVGLRLATIAALVLLLFDPVRTDYRTLRRYPTVAVMADLSQSMARQDNWSDDAVAKPIADALKMSLDEFRAAKLSRMQIVQRLLSAEQALPQALRSKANVRVMTFGGQIDTAGTLPSLDEANAEKEEEAQTSENETEAAPQNDPFQSLVAQVSQWQAEGASTDLSGAIQAALGVNQLRALYLLSDGQHTGSSQPVELAQRAAEMGIPVYAIGVGDPARPRNAAVRDATVLAKARPNEPFSIDTVVTASEMAGSSLQLELYRIATDEDGTASEPERVDSKEISVLDQAWLSRERFTQRVENPGRYRYEVRIAPIDGELDVADNAQETSMVEITNEKIRLLLISGGPTWEYQNLRKLFERDPGILVSCWLQSLAPERSQEGNDRISVLPRSFEDLSRYNAILMIDPNPDEFDEAWVEALTKFVERKAGGLLFMAGPKYTSDFLTLPRTTNVKQLLPVRLESAADASLSTLLQVSSGVPAIDVVDANLDHPVMSFTADRPTNQRIWTAMPGTYWSFPAIAAKPTAKTLVEHQDATLSLDGESRRPLLVAGRYGAGNTLYIGFPGTWRWRSVGVQAEYYDRFWIQAVRYLTDTRSIQGLKRGTVDPDREFYELGDRVELAAQLLGPTFEPLDLPEVSGTLKVDEGTPLPITFRQVEGQPGQYVTTIRARTVGRYEVAVDLADVTDPSLLEPARFRVEAPSAETKATWLNEPLLREICDASGGAYYRVDQLEEAVASLSTGFETVEWREPPKPVWDLTGTTRTLMFLLPVLLLAIEWGVRKWAKLL